MLIDLRPRAVRVYGCTRCQRYHREDREPDLFERHLAWQSKHGVTEVTDPGHWARRPEGGGP